MMERKIITVLILIGIVWQRTEGGGAGTSYTYKGEDWPDTCETVSLLAYFW